MAASRRWRRRGAAALSDGRALCRTRVRDHAEDADGEHAGQNAGEHVCDHVGEHPEQTVRPRARQSFLHLSS